MFRYNTPFNQQVKNFVFCDKITKIKIQTRFNIRQLSFYPKDSLIYEGYKEASGVCWNRLVKLIFLEHKLFHKFFLQEDIYFCSQLLDIDALDTETTEEANKNIYDICNLVLGIRRASYYKTNVSPGVSKDYILDTLDNENYLWDKLIRFFEFTIEDHEIQVFFTEAVNH